MGSLPPCLSDPFLVLYLFVHPKISDVADIPTKLSASINPDALSSPALIPCFAASIATIMSPLHILNKAGDNVHPYATPCKISIYFVPNMYTWSFQLRFYINPAPPLFFFPSPAPFLFYRSNLTECLPTVLRVTIPL